MYVCIYIYIYTLFVKNVINDSIIKMSNIVGDTLGMSVLDSVCSRTVAERLWFDIFFDTLNDWDKYLVKTGV